MPPPAPGRLPLGGVGMDLLRWNLAHADDGSVRLGVAGEIDLDTRDQFDAALSEAVAVAGDSVVVDLSEVAFMGSEGVNSLVRVRQQAHRHAVDVTVVAATPCVRLVLSVMGVSDLLADGGR